MHRHFVNVFFFNSSKTFSGIWKSIPRPQGHCSMPASVPSEVCSCSKRCPKLPKSSCPSQLGIWRNPIPPRSPLLLSALQLSCLFPRMLLLLSLAQESLSHAGKPAGSRHRLGLARVIWKVSVCHNRRPGAITPPGTPALQCSSLLCCSCLDCHHHTQVTSSGLWTLLHPTNSPSEGCSHSRRQAKLPMLAGHWGKSNILRINHCWLPPLCPVTLLPFPLAAAAATQSCVGDDIHHPQAEERWEPGSRAEEQRSAAWELKSRREPWRHFYLPLPTR